MSMIFQNPRGSLNPVFSEDTFSDMSSELVGGWGSAATTASIDILDQVGLPVHALFCGDTRTSYRAACASVS